MPWWGWSILAAVIILLTVGLLLLRLARRLDRLHRRVISSRNGLGRRLVKRGAELLRISELPGIDREVAKKLRFHASDALDKAELGLASDGLDVVQGRPLEAELVEERLRAESMLSRVIRTELAPEMRDKFRSDPVSMAQFKAFDDACYRVELIRVLHNQDVAQVRALRSKFLVRAFRLSGSAPSPQYVDLDDQVL